MAFACWEEIREGGKRQSQFSVPSILGREFGIKTTGGAVFAGVLKKLRSREGGEALHVEAKTESMGTYSERPR